MFRNLRRLRSKSRRGYFQRQRPDGRHGRRKFPGGVLAQRHARRRFVRSAGFRGVRRTGRPGDLPGTLDPDHQRRDDQKRQLYDHLRIAGPGRGQHHDRSSLDQGR